MLQWSTNLIHLYPYIFFCSSYVTTATLPNTPAKCVEKTIKNSKCNCFSKPYEMLKMFKKLRKGKYVISTHFYYSPANGPKYPLLRLVDNMTGTSKNNLQKLAKFQKINNKNTLNWLIAVQKVSRLYQVRLYIATLLLVETLDCYTLKPANALYGLDNFNRHNLNTNDPPFTKFPCGKIFLLFLFFQFLFQNHPT